MNGLQESQDRGCRITLEELHLIVLPTEQCNFRCSYCFEDFALGRMEPGVVVGLKKLLTASAPGIEQLTLHWYGGEPLLARDIIEDVQEHALDLLRLHPRIRFHGALTTNAYLLRRETFVRLLDLGVRHYQVTFDGPREQHDLKRRRAGGQGTFERIWGNLLQARSIRGTFSILVRVHVNRDNRESVPRFLAAFREAFGDDARFAVFLRPVARLGGAGNACTDVFPQPQARRVTADVRNAAERLGLNQFDAGTGPALCYAAHPAVWVVRSDGRLSKCTVALSHPANHVGRLGEDGRLRIHAERLGPWLRGLASGEREALACPARKLTQHDPAGRTQEPN